VKPLEQGKKYIFMDKCKWCGKMYNREESTARLWRSIFCSNKCEYEDARALGKEEQYRKEVQERERLLTQRRH